MNKKIIKFIVGVEIWFPEFIADPTDFIDQMLDQWNAQSAAIVALRINVRGHKTDAITYTFLYGSFQDLAINARLVFSRQLYVQKTPSYGNYRANVYNADHSNVYISLPFRIDIDSHLLTEVRSHLHSAITHLSNTKLPGPKTDDYYFIFLIYIYIFLFFTCIKREENS